MSSPLIYLLLGQAPVERFETTEFDFPETTAGLILLLTGLVLLFGLTVHTSLRDSRFLSPLWRGVLLVPRLFVFVLLLFVLLNPRQRTQTSQIQKSRVAVLIDSSLSMEFPATDSESTESDSARSDDASLTRTQAIRDVLVDNNLLQRISETHSVSVYTFDDRLAGPHAVITDGETAFAVEDRLNEDSQDESDDDQTVRVSLDTEGSGVSNDEMWNQIFQSQGAETRLGESLHELIGQMAGRTLSGIVVITDGRNNGGLDTEIAQLRAERSETRIIAIGTGGTKPQMNTWIAGMQSPSDVHRGDPFDISVVIQSNGLSGQAGKLRLFQQSAGGDGSDQQLVAEKPVEFPEDGLPSEVVFQQQLQVPGKFEYIAKVVADDGSITELTEDDNERRRVIEVTDRKIKVLVISSGPMREYQFVRNTLFRHSGIDSDVWLQTVTEENVGMVSQESTELLTRFPDTEAELFKYDVIVAFDADWGRLSSEEQKHLNRWVAEHAGGVIFVAGEIFTPELARKSDELHDVAVLYPVVLNRLLVDLKVTQRADEPWPVVLTPEGRSSDFLKIADATGNNTTDLWKTFSGIFRSYPIRSVRDGAVVLAQYGNPRARTQDGQPPFIASQYYGAGRAIFIGSAETWRLRSISSEGHQRLWTSLIREVGQGRRQRGNSRGLLLLDQSDVSPGQPVTIRAQLYNARLQPFQSESVPVSIVDENGRPVSPPEFLREDPRKAGQFAGIFRPSAKGTYRVTVPIPESSDQLQGNIEVVLPNLESDNPSQNVSLLEKLVANTGGTYLTLDAASQELPTLLPDRSEPVIVDEQLRTLWDRNWLMYLMIGLLSLEWLLRRVVRLS